MDRDKDSEFTNGMMAAFTKEIGSTIKQMEKGSSNNQMVPLTKAR